jgi:hypothetical protein
MIIFYFQEFMYIHVALCSLMRDRLDTWPYALNMLLCVA